MPLNQFIVILENNMLNKYLGETQAPGPWNSPEARLLSFFLHSQLGKKRRKKKKQIC